MSKDGVLMVLHGSGYSGTLKKYGFPADRVFEWTKEELQTRIDLGGGERIPTLEEVLLLCEQSPYMVLNLEMKTPSRRKWSKRYDSERAVRRVLYLIDQYKIGHRTILSSFDPWVLQRIVGLSPRQELREFKVLLLCDDATCFNDFVTPEQLEGNSINYNLLNEERMESIVDGGKNSIGIYSSITDGEGPERWEKVFSFKGGVDYFYSDKPIEATRARNRIATSGLFIRMFRAKDDLFFKIEGQSGLNWAKACD